MDTFLKNFILLIFLSNGKKTIQLYSYSVEGEHIGIDWFTASRKCNETGTNLEHDILKLSDMAELTSNEFWIGIIKYDELTPWIELIGCFLSNYTNIEEYMNTELSVGYCQQRCHSQPYFGYIGSSCRCLNREDFIKLIEVNISYCYTNSFVNDTTLVYQSFDCKSCEVSNGNCMVLKCQNGMQQSPRNCLKEDNAIRTLCNGFVEPPNQSWGLVYTKAQEVCLQMNKMLISPHNCSTKLTSYAWTSAFRMVVTLDYLKEKPGLEPIACLSGHRRISSESIDVITTPRPCNDTLEHFVCTSEPCIESTSPPVKHPEHGTTDFKNLLSTGQKFQLTTTKLIALQNRTTIKGSKANKGGVIGGVVGGIITVFLVTVLILWIYRGRNNKNNKIPTVKKSPANSSNENHAANMQFGLVESTIPTVDEYAMVNKGNGINNRSMPVYSAVKTNYAFPNPKDTYVTAAEEEYDKLNNILSRKKENDRNIYGITGLCGGDEYDTMKRVLGSNIRQTDDLYDTNDNISSEKGDQTYDNSNIVQLKQNIISNDVSDYAK